MKRSAADFLDPGQIVAERYEIIELLGAGGFSVVYKARQLSTGKLVAIKILLPDRLSDEEQAPLENARFEREMRLIANVKHPNIVPLIDSGHIDQDGDRLFIVLEFIEGETLGDVVRHQGVLDVRETKRLMTEVLDALSAAHTIGIVHRDLKPQNIMLTESGMRRVAMVLDFGVAGVIEDHRSDEYAELTGEGQVPGTPAYMAPEQIRTDVLDPQSDIYAWGLVFVECLTGRKAFGSNSLAKTIAKQLSPAPVPIPEPLKRHPLGDILRKATAKDTATRYKNTQEILPALDACVLDDALVEALEEYIEGNPPLDTSKSRSQRSIDPRARTTDAPSDDVTKVSNSDRKKPQRATTQPSEGSRPVFEDETSGGHSTNDPSLSNPSPIRPEAPARGKAIAIGAIIGLIIAGVAGAYLLGMFGSGSDSAAETQVPEDDTVTDTADVTDTVQTVATEQDVSSAPADIREVVAVDAANDPVDVPAEVVDTTLQMDMDPEQACKDGNMEACVMVGLRALSSRTPDYATAARVFQTACQGDHQGGCVEFGKLFQLGKGVQFDIARAYQLYETSCAAGEGAGCTHQAQMVLEGQGVRKDTEKAVALFTKACDAKDPEGCGELGNLVLRGRGGLEADNERAAKLIAEACEMGHGRSCSRIGSMLQEGDKIAINVPAGLAAFERACELGYSRGCSKLAFTYTHGKGVAKDPVKAANFYEKSCNLGLTSSCATVCYMYQVGDGIQEDAARARDLCALSCVGRGDGTGCYRYGLMVRDGYGGPSDPDAANAAFVKACKRGEKAACRLRKK